MDHRLITIFNNTFIDFNGEVSISEDKLLNFYNIVCEFEQNDVSKYPWIMRNYHFFYQFCVIFKRLNKTEEDVVKYYLPSLFFILKHSDKRLITHLTSIFTKSKLAVKKQIATLSDHTPIILNEEKIKIDTLNIFFKSFFLDVDPINITDLDKFYYSSLNHILLTYLKNYDHNETINLLEDVTHLLEIQEQNLTKCNRVIVYDNALKRVEISDFVNSSDYALTINSNLKELEVSIITNDMQDLFNKLTTGNVIIDPKLSIMSMFSNKHELTQIITNHCPYVLKLLRSVCVPIDRPINQDQFNYIKRYISDSIYLCLLKHNYSKDNSLTISDNIAISMATSLCSKEYFDILTLSIVKIHTSIMWDLKTLLVYLLTGKLSSKGK